MVDCFDYIWLVKKNTKLLHFSYVRVTTNYKIHLCWKDFFIYDIYCVLISINF